MLVAVVVVALQVASWYRNGEWEDYRLSTISNILKGGYNVRYVTARSDMLATELTFKQMIVDWLLDIPVVAALLVVVVVHLACYCYLASLEKRASNH
jgi:hypothetical protein